MAFGEKKISRYKRSGLLSLWNSIAAGDTPEWESGKAFEHLVLRAFELEGAEVRWPYRVTFEGEEIEQIDGVVYTEEFAMKQAYIVTDNEAAAEIIKKILPKNLAKSIAFIAGSGDYSAWSKAGTLLFVKHLPVALVINTHTVNDSK